MKLTTGILILGMTAGGAWAQNPSIIGIEKNKLNAVAQQKLADSNEALGVSQEKVSSAPKVAARTTSKPSAGTPKSKPGQVAPSSSQASQGKGGQDTVIQAKSSPKAVPTKAASVPAKTTLVSASQVAPSPKTAGKPLAADPKSAAPQNARPVAVEDKQNPTDAKKAPAKTFSMTGKRDPFLSPVVNHTLTGSGCSSGKRCLSIDQIALKGVVKGDGGMIAVVVNALDKAYFLRENDPVFNGFVVKITGDSIVFKQSMQDRLGKTFMREVTKKISTPAV